MRQFDRQSERRIARAVIWTERQTRTEAAKRRRLRPLPSGAIVGIVKNDIEHGAFGTVELAEGSDFDSSLTADTNRSYTAYNPFLKLWAGSEVRLDYTRLAGIDAKYNVAQHFSATRIRCTAPASGGLTAGGSGTCTSVTALDGHFSPTTATVYSWTTNVDVDASAKLLAELVWTGTVSRWEIYSADCT